MNISISRRVKAALLSLLILGSVYGCAGQPQGVRNPGDTAGQTAGADAGATLPGGTAGDAMTARTRARVRTDLGQQISNSVARALSGGGRFVGMGTTWGRVAGAKPIGVSTLVIGDMAFVGIDTTTLPAGWNATNRAGATGTADRTMRGTAAGSAGGTAAGQTGTAAGQRTGTNPGTATNTPIDANRARTGRTLTAADTTPRNAAGTTATLEDRIRTQVRAAFPQVDEVYVTTDPALVARIARAARSLQAGRASSTQLSELFAIAKAMLGE